ncbi:MAG: 3-hydroxyacyl-CoA dehydrogenase family protein [Sedimentibacter sp.]|uniref:3-hydroxyacyl-CoA dehydrogenase family protein n=1 Tax=Sedimentibacter sp. TaxID=1960295 RepID=UPI0031590EA0
MIKKVTVVGGGVMGKQIALNCAINGMETNLVDNVEAALEKVGEWSKEYLSGRVAKGKMTQDEMDAAVAKFHLMSDMEAACKDTDLVIEAIVEKLEAKKSLFETLDKITPEHTILVSNSSTFKPSSLCGSTNRADRVANLHYFNPALQMKLVEIVISPETSEETVAELEEFAKATNKVPIKVLKEIDGFVVNNILGGITKVAWFLLENGYASAEDIDLGAEKGLGHPMGPFKTLDLAGLDTILDVRRARYEAFGDESEKPPKILEEMVARGELGRKSGKGFYEYK